MSTHDTPPQDKGNSNADQSSDLGSDDSTAKRPIEDISFATGKRRQSTTTPEEEEIKRQKRMAASRRSAAASRQRRLDLIEDLKKSVIDLNKTITDLRTENIELRGQLQRQKAAMRANLPLVQVGGRVLSDPRMGLASVGTVPSMAEELPAQFQLAGFPRNAVLSASAALTQEQPHPYPLPSPLGVRQDALSHPSHHPDAVTFHRQPVNQGILSPHEELQRQLTRQQQELDSIIQALQSGKKKS